MATNKSKSTAPATINPKNFTIPLRKEFIDYLQPFKTRGSANSYATYVKNIVDGYYNQTGINLSTPIDGCSIIYHKDRDTILQIIFSEVYTNRHELGINDKKLSGFLSYMDFISEFQTNQIRKLLKGYYNGTYKKTSVPSNILSQNTTTGVNIIFSRRQLRDNFLLRLFTQNRIAPDNPYYFPITLIKKCETVNGSILGIAATPEYKSVTDFFNKEVSKIRFLGYLNNNITPIQLNRISTLQIDIHNSTVSFTTVKGVTYDLYTEVLSNNHDGVIQINENFFAPIKRIQLRDIVIDHDPEIASVMKAAANNNWLPRLGVLTKHIQDAIEKIYGPNATISSDTKINKPQLNKVYDLWQQNESFPQLPNLLLDIIYLQSPMTLTIMDTTVNGNKNGIDKPLPQLNNPYTMIPNY